MPCTPPAPMAMQASPRVTWLNGAQVRKVEDYFPSSYGIPRADDRRIISDTKPGLKSCVGAGSVGSRGNTWTSNARLGRERPSPPSLPPPTSSSATRGASRTP